MEEYTGFQDARKESIPPNGSTNAKCDAHLMWLAGYGASAHNVYFGTDFEAVNNANTSSPEFKGRMEVPGNIVDPGSLQEAKQYYWRVDTLITSTVIEGTLSAPNKITH